MADDDTPVLNLTELMFSHVFEAGNLDEIKRMITEFGITNINQLHETVLCKAATHLNVLQYLFEYFGRVAPECNLPTLCMKHAAEVGNLESVVYCREVMKMEWHPQTMCRAAHHGFMPILEYCIKERCPFNTDWTFNAACNAAFKGQLDALHYLLTHGDTSCILTVGSLAGQFCQIHVLEYLHNTYHPDDIQLDFLYFACHYQDLQMLQYVIDWDCPIRPDVYKYCAKGQCLEMLQPLWELGEFVKQSPTITFEEVVEARERHAVTRGKRHHIVLQAAAEVGNITLVQALLADGYSVNHNVIEAAINARKIDCASLVLSRAYKVVDDTMKMLDDYVSGTMCSAEELDFDTHAGFRVLFKYVDTQVVSASKHSSLWRVVKTKMDEIDLQQQYATLMNSQDNSRELPIDVLQHVLLPYF